MERNFETNIIAANLIVKHAREIFMQESEHFKKLVMKDIFKQDGTLKKNYARSPHSFKGMFEHTFSEGLKTTIFYDTHGWYEKSGHTMYLRVKTCISGGSYDTRPSTAFTVYKSIYLRLGDYSPSNNCLMAVNSDTTPLDVEYNGEEILEAARQVKLIADQYEEAVKKIPNDFREILRVRNLRF